MNMTSQIQVLETMIQEALAAHPEHFLVDITVKPGNNIRLHIDGDQGISIEKLVQYNRSLYKQIEEGGLFADGDFALEVSSPGLDEPLKLHRQYVKNKGRKVELVLTDGSRKEGKLLDVNETELVLEEEKGRDGSGKPTGKKKELVQQTIPFSNIKTTKVQVTF